MRIDSYLLISHLYIVTALPVGEWETAWSALLIPNQGYDPYNLDYKKLRPQLREKTR